jgi:hypothetical protein
LTFPLHQAQRFFDPDGGPDAFTTPHYFLSNKSASKAKTTIPFKRNQSKLAVAILIVLLQSIEEGVGPSSRQAIQKRIYRSFSEWFQHS